MILSAKKEYVELPTLSGHASNLCRFQGRSYLTWFGGSKESADDVDIYVCRREAVSYTHLDVYKRQVRGSWLNAPCTGQVVALRPRVWMM